MSFIKLTPEAIQATKAFLEEKGVMAPIRIDIQSTGCCDPSLGLSLDRTNDSDLVHECEGLQFVMSPEIRRLVGDVTVDWVDQPSEKGYVVTATRPLSEWEGFGVCDIRVPDKE